MRQQIVAFWKQRLENLHAQTPKRTTMKAYTYCTPSHKKLLDDWLKKYLPNDLELTVAMGEQHCKSGTYHRHGWNECMQQKVKLSIQAAEETMDDAFLHVDTDVQFFGPVEAVLRKELENHDIVAQDDRPEGRKGASFCGGFFACRSNKQVRTFWLDVLKVVQEDSSVDDQVAFNRVARNSQLRVGALSRDEFWSRRSFWTPGKSLEPSENILMHHANWTKGINHKNAQLAAVRKLVENGRKATFLGSDYGGYHVRANRLNPSSVIYSFGIGEDASFEISLANETDATIHAFDPTPRSVVWAEKNLSGISKICFYPYGVLDKTTDIPFYMPKNNSHVSCSIYAISSQKIQAPVKRLSEIANKLGHGQIDLLKLDIEGAEHAVIRDMFANGIYPSQLLVEFHDRITGANATQQTKELLCNKGYICYHRAHHNYSFERQ